ncbi:MAG: hypothetical protein WCO40_03585 [Thermoleophilia bacterium]
MSVTIPTLVAAHPRARIAKNVANSSLTACAELSTASFRSPRLTRQFVSRLSIARTEEQR